MRAPQAGITLIELVIVMAIIGMVAGITWPAVANGLESVRLSSATESVASFLNAATNLAERRQEVVELAISPRDNTILMHSIEAAGERRLELPEGIAIQAVLPPIPQEDNQAPRQFLLMPGGTAPRVGIELANRRGSRRIVRVDPMTGIPRIEAPSEQPEP